MWEIYGVPYANTRFSKGFSTRRWESISVGTDRKEIDSILGIPLGQREIQEQDTTGTQAFYSESRGHGDRYVSYWIEFDARDRVKSRGVDMMD